MPSTPTATKNLISDLEQTGQRFTLVQALLLEKQAQLAKVETKLQSPATSAVDLERLITEKELFTSEVERLSAEVCPLESKIAFLENEIQALESSAREKEQRALIKAIKSQLPDQIQRINQLSSELGQALQEFYTTVQPALLAAGELGEINRLVAFSSITLPQVILGDGHFYSWTVATPQLTWDPQGAASAAARARADQELREQQRQVRAQEVRSSREAEAEAITAHRIQELEAVAGNQSLVPRAREQAQRDLNRLQQ